jgi:hypothetical protein
MGYGAPLPEALIRAAQALTLVATNSQWGLMLAADGASA